MEIILYRDWRNQPLRAVRQDVSNEEAQVWLGRALDSRKPFMAARFGNCELQLMVHFHKMKNLALIWRLLDPIETWKWSFSWFKMPLREIEINAGFFPQDVRLIRQFVTIMHECITEVDLLASWCKGEVWFEDQLGRATVCHRDALEAYRYQKPWTAKLAGRKVLVVHPFETSIRSQYEKQRTKLFSSPDVLPDFELHTLKAVQSIAGNRPEGFKTWFEALDYMTDRAIASPADVVILGCGAYGFPLAARLKRAGKQCIHMGGVTQLLFGIRGAAYDRPDSFVTRHINEYWIRPAPEERPKGAELVEGACYW